MNSSVERPRFDWYETDQNIVLNLLIKQMDPNRLTVKFEPRRLWCQYRNDETKSYELELMLNGEIVPHESSYRVSAVKAEIKMRKVANFRWDKLEAAGGDTGSGSTKPPVAMNSVASTSNPAGPSIRKPAWDSLVKELEKEEEENGGVEDLFRKIYSSGNDELRKAMNKSFVESNGTVLSTNWNEVSQSKVEMKPPDSVEYKKWDS